MECSNTSCTESQLQKLLLVKRTYIEMIPIRKIDPMSHYVWILVFDDQHDHLIWTNDVLVVYMTWT
jgi:DUF971 family protein